MMSEVFWPNLPVKKIVPLKERLEFYIKSRDTSEQLIPTAPNRDGNLEYQFYYNKASKLVGYRFSLDPVRSGSELFPRMSVFTSSVMASYVPLEQVESLDGGDFFVVYHDLNIRLIRYNVKGAGHTYCILMRSKLDGVG